MLLSQKERQLIEVGITCSILALYNDNPVNQSFLTTTTFKSSRDTRLVTKKILKQLLHNNKTPKTVQILASYLIQYLRNSTSTIKSNRKKNRMGELRFQQYLRRFSFFYKYYYLQYYPNNLNQLSQKKTNMLAIQSLFILQSL